MANSQSKDECPVGPVLSSSETRIFVGGPELEAQPPLELSDKQIFARYEIGKTADSILENSWKRIGLQLWDQDLIWTSAIVRLLGRDLAFKSVEKGSPASRDWNGSPSENRSSTNAYQIFVLADTSYSACCIDEIAAEHVRADVVVHYGRTCLSPTSRIPVIYVFVTLELDVSKLIRIFALSYPQKDVKIILTADVCYEAHLPTAFERIREKGYTNVSRTEIIHNPSSKLPNRKILCDSLESSLQAHELFHIGIPPPALQLILSSRFKQVKIFDPASPNRENVAENTAGILRRRYALLTSLSTASVFGILINTLSVANYMSVLSHVQSQISQAGKKSYTFVVGKLNPAKLANFAEIDGWVVIGCWESSLIGEKSFYRPVITPFELNLAMESDKERLWTGEWTADFTSILKQGHQLNKATDKPSTVEEASATEVVGSEEESEPPEFDLRNGRFVSHTMIKTSDGRNVQLSTTDQRDGKMKEAKSNSLAKRVKGDLALIGGLASPGAQYLRTVRTWAGLGSDFDNENTVPEESATELENGRTGVARGYSTVKIKDEGGRT